MNQGNGHGQGHSSTGPPPPMPGMGPNGGGQMDPMNQYSNHHNMMSPYPNQMQSDRHPYPMSTPQHQNGAYMTQQHPMGSQNGMNRNPMMLDPNSWQNKNSYPEERNAMIRQIMEILKVKKRDASPQWSNKLPDMAKKLEDRLFFGSSSIEEYKNRATLTERLQQIALSITDERNRMRKMMSNQHGNSGPQFNNQMVTPSHHMMRNQTPMHHQTRGTPGGYNQVPTPAQMGTPSMGQPPTNPSRVPSRQEMSQRMGNMQRHPSHIQQQPPPPQVASASHMNGRTDIADSSDIPTLAPPGSSTTQQMAQANAGQGNMAGRGMAARTPTQERQRQQVLRQQQQRLLLLRHASRCPYPEGTCTATSNCSEYKKLWLHIANCRDQSCDTPHCVSSRYVLSHYHRCQEASCAVCGPVREAIDRHNKLRIQDTSRRRMPPYGGVNPAYPGGPPPPGHHQMGEAAPVGSQHQIPNGRPQPVIPVRQGPTPQEIEERERKLAELQEMKRQAEEARRIQEEKIRQAEEEILRLQQTSSAVTTPGPQTSAAVSSAMSFSAAQSSVYSGQVRTASTSFYNNGQMDPSKRVKTDATAGTMTQSVQLTQEEIEKKKKETAEMFQVALRGKSSLIYTFSAEEICAHMKSLSSVYCQQMRSGDIKSRALGLIKTLLDQELAWIFNKPVDPKELKIPDYLDVVKHPMDLGTVKKNIEMGHFKSLREFADQVRLVFNNAMLYNGEGSDVNSLAREYGWRFEKDYHAMLRSMEEEEDRLKMNENACKLCGGEKFLFEPPVYYCNGKCNQKIRRSAYFYATPDNKQFYCVSCHQSFVKDSVLLEDGSVVAKDAMIKKKNDESQEESWVECTICKKWFHQICVLFNGRSNDQSREADPFCCPFCVLRYMDKNRITEFPAIEDKQEDENNESSEEKRLLGAKDLPTCKYSEFLERRVKERLEAARKKESWLKNRCLEEIEEGGEIFVRVVSCKNTEVLPRDGLKQLYGKDYPDSFPHKAKCVLLFQKIDGVDVLILGLYTQVYGEDCPEPNRRSLYISYLDSVYYFFPRFARTDVYHELLEATLAYEKRRGITKTFIWVCPPLAGDDYILYCHPKDQKTPKADMLRNWYFQLLENSRKNGVVKSLDNLHDEYLQRVTDVTQIPNFDGDYWPGVSEQFIHQLRQDQIDPRSIAPRKKRVYGRSKQNYDIAGGKKKSKKTSSKKQKKPKKKSNSVTGAFSSIESQVSVVVQQVADEVSDVVMPPKPEDFLPPKPLPLLDTPQQDALTVKIADVIHQMKDDFMVVRMHHICSDCCRDIDQKDDIYWLPEQYDPSKLSFDFAKRRYAAPFCLCDVCFRRAYKSEFGSLDSVVLKKYKSIPYDDEDEDPIPEIDEIKETLFQNEIAEVLNSLVINKLENSDRPQLMKSIEMEKEEEEEKVSDPPPPPPPSGVSAFAADLYAAENSLSVLPPGVNAARRSAWITPPRGLDMKMMRPFRCSIPRDTLDPDPEVDCQIFDTRQAFLSLCQGNKYQFDQLRRAKHTSMMVLYHLHNPDLPSFVHTCNMCRTELSSGVRFTCNECDDFDLCRRCAGHSRHQHRLMPVHAKTGQPIDSSGFGSHGLTREQEVARRKRVSSMMASLNLLQHAVSCRNRMCQVRNCEKMKSFLDHGVSCSVKSLGGCDICKKVWALLHLHARQCRHNNGECNVPNCRELKLRWRKKSMQTQDRRIRMQNERMAQERQRQMQQQTIGSPVMRPSESPVAQHSSSSGKFVGKQ